MKIKINVDIKVGRLVKYFIISDFFLLAGWGFIDPVFSVFIIDKVQGATLMTVGIAAAIYWILRAILQIPIANYLDKHEGEKDDFMALVLGIFLVGLSAIAMCWVTQIWELYALHAVHAIAFALYYSSWPTIFSRHLDKDRISFDWSLDSTAAGVAAGITGFLGGTIAQVWGYNVVFFLAGILAFVAAFVLVSMPDIILPKPLKGALASPGASEPIMKEHPAPPTV